MRPPRLCMTAAPVIVVVLAFWLHFRMQLPAYTVTSVTLRQWLQDGEFDCALNSHLNAHATHVGVIGALQREGLLRNLCGIAGTSAGGITGAFIAANKTVLDPSSSIPILHQDAKFFDYTNRPIPKVYNFSFGLGITDGSGLENDLVQNWKLPSTFEELKIPFACNAWSARTFTNEIFSKGSLIRALRASCGVPILYHPTSHGDRKWLYDGAIGDYSGSSGLSALPKQPRRSLNFVVNRVPQGLWVGRLTPPSKYGALREEVVTIRLNQPPLTFFGEGTFRLFKTMILNAANATLEALDIPMQAGPEAGHYVLEVDVSLNRKSAALPQNKL